MAYFPTIPEVEKSIRLAMKYKAPMQYANLKRAGKLDAAIKARVEAYERQISEAWNPMVFRLAKEDPPDRVQQEKRAERAIVEAALANATAFAPDDSAS